MLIMSELTLRFILGVGLERPISDVLDDMWTEMRIMDGPDAWDPDMKFSEIGNLTLDNGFVWTPTTVNHPATDLYMLDSEELRALRDWASISQR
jgi:hypothetical protein